MVMSTSSVSVQVYGYTDTIHAHLSSAPRRARGTQFALADSGYRRGKMMRNVVPSPSDDSSSRLASSISHSLFTMDNPMPSPAFGFAREVVDCDAMVGAESSCGSTWPG